MRTQDGYELTLSLVRHGRTPMNDEKRYIGRTDQSLSETGRKTLEELRGTVAYPEGEALFVSPMKRARESAAILYPDTEQIVIEGFRELDFGDFEGRNYAELKEDPAYRAWIDSAGSQTPPGGEDMGAYRERIRRGMEEVLEQSEDLARAVIVAHGGIIMSLMSMYTGCGYYDAQVKNGAGFTVKVRWGKDEKGNLQVSHFESVDRFGPGSDHR